jgi:hypothetical protein
MSNLEREESDATWSEVEGISVVILFEIEGISMVFLIILVSIIR